jgi:hypothetical protein
MGRRRIRYAASVAAVAEQVVARLGLTSTPARKGIKDTEPVAVEPVLS